jgi:hypothetical protein
MGRIVLARWIGAAAWQGPIRDALQIAARGIDPAAGYVRADVFASGHYLHRLWARAADGKDHSDRSVAADRARRGVGPAGQGADAADIGPEYVPKGHIQRWKDPERRRYPKGLGLRIEALSPGNAWRQRSVGCLRQCLRYGHRPARRRRAGRFRGQSACPVRRVLYVGQSRGGEARLSRSLSCGSS